MLKIKSYKLARFGITNASILIKKHIIKQRYSATIVMNNGKAYELTNESTNEEMFDDEVEQFVNEKMNLHG